MGVFPPSVLDAFVAPINMISSVGTFVGDPWILPNPTEVKTYGDTMPLLPAERTYSAIQSKFVSAICSPKEDKLDQYSLPKWTDFPSSSSQSTTLSLQSLGSSAPRVVLSLTTSSLPASQDPIPLPSSLVGETLPTSNHTYQRSKQKGGRCRK